MEKVKTPLELTTVTKTQEASPPRLRVYVGDLSAESLSDKRELKVRLVILLQFT